MYNTYIRRGDVSKKASAKDSSGQHFEYTFGRTNVQPVPKVCDQKDTAPVWGYILRQKRLSIILEPSIKKTINHWSPEIADLVALDLEEYHEMRMELYQNISISTFGVAGSHMVEKSEKLGIIPY